MVKISPNQPKFPSIFRFITELPRVRQLFYLKIFGFSFVTTFLLVSIMLRGYQLFEGIQVLHAASLQREELQKERAYWQDVAVRHPGYRDAEFKLAVVTYELGDKVKAKEYLDKAFSIDPNFEQGRAFAKQVGLE